VNTLRIKLNPYKDINIASLDDRPLSPYSELNNFMKEPFLKWAYQLLEATERELNDDFRLTVVGEEFETAFLNDMQNDYDACVSYEQEKFQIAYSVEQRYQIIRELSIKYGASIDTANYRMPVYSDVSVEIPEDMAVEAGIENAALYITGSKDVVNNNMGGNRVKIFVLVSNISKVTCIGNMQYVWEVEENRLSSVVQMIIERFVKVPLIVDVARSLETKKTSFDGEDREKLALATEIDMFVHVDEMPDLEVGEVYEPQFRTTPAGELLPPLRMVSLNPNVIAVDGSTLVAQEIGKTVIEFYKAEEIIPFARQEICTYKDNFVQQIILSVEEKKMGTGKEQQIGLSVFPEDAEDSKQVKWSVDNESIAVVDDQGKITSKAAGVVQVTASTMKVNEVIEIRVMPNISEIVLSCKKVELYVGETQNIEIQTTPQEVFCDETEWKTSDKSVAIIEKTDDGSEIIRATGIGECQLTCIAKEGGCQAKCNVLVESTFKKRENMHSWLSFAFVCLIVCVLCGFFSVDIGKVVGAAATILCGLIAIIKNKKDCLWAIVMMVIAVIMILG